MVTDRSLSAIASFIVTQRIMGAVGAGLARDASHTVRASGSIVQPEHSRARRAPTIPLGRRGAGGRRRARLASPETPATLPSTALLLTPARRTRAGGGVGGERSAFA